MSEPKFVPKPGQVDFTNIRWVPVINCVVECEGKILLVKRSQNMRLYPGLWNSVSGFLDDNKSLEEKVQEELREELGIPAENIVSIKLGRIFDREAPEYGKTWIIHPVLVEVSSKTVKLDWEAEKYAWVTLEEAKQMELLPGLELLLSELLNC